MRKNVVLFLLMILPMLSVAQRWKGYRYDIVFGAGASNFLGDLGGANQFGTHLLRDLNWQSTRYSLTFGVRYRLGEYTSLRGNLAYGRLRGSDAIKNVEFYRHYRNLSFRSGVAEFNVLYEASFMKEQIGRKLRLRGVKGRRGYELYVFGFVGLGGFYFDPRGFDGSKWVRLKKLHTEGQTIIASRPREYSSFQFCIPFGIAFKYAINRRWGVALEYGLRYTFTDYLDDVSSTYVDPDLLRTQKNGELAAAMADKTDKTRPDITSAGSQRGDPRYNDAYMFALITFNYKLKTTRANLPKF